MVVYCVRLAKRYGSDPLSIDSIDPLIDIFLTRGEAIKYIDNSRSEKYYIQCWKVKEKWDDE